MDREIIIGIVKNLNVPFRDLRETKHDNHDLYPACFEDVVIKALTVWYPQMTLNRLRGHLRTWMQRQHNVTKK